MKKTRLLILLLLCAIFSLTGISAGALRARAEEHYNAKSALLMDYYSGEILFQQNPTQRLQIASMVKIMTLLLSFEEIDNGNLKLDDMINVSENASSMGGSQAFLDAHCDYKVEELIKSIIVASANDSCVAMAEHIAGSVENFVEKMNKKAEELGLCDTYFVNCTGLPAPNQYSCARDVAIMSRELFSHKKYFDYAGIWMFDFVHPSGRITGLTNTNKLVRFYEGCDGGKTGYTDEAGSCLSATAQRGNSRFISVIIGAPSSKERNAQISKMLNTAFATYETKCLVFKGKQLGKAPVIGGKQSCIDYCAAEDLFKLTKKGEQQSELRFETILNKIKAPVRQGDVVGKVDIYSGQDLIGSCNLLSMTDIDKENYMDIVDNLIEKW